MEIWYLLLFLILVPGLLAQLSVSAAIKKYSRVPTQSGRSGAEAATELMDDAGIHDVQIIRTDSFLGDHYDPRKKTLALSPAVYTTAVPWRQWASLLTRPATRSSTSTPMRLCRCEWPSFRSACLRRDSRGW